MSSRDTAHSITVKPLFNPVAATVDNTAWVSQIIDTNGYEALTLAFQTGTLADADATFTTTITHGDVANLSDGAAVAASDLTDALSTANFDFSFDNSAKKIGYIGQKRYVQVTVTPANNTGNVFLAGLAILARPRNMPSA
jgi:hypothetical protein